MCPRGNGAPVSAQRASNLSNKIGRDRETDPSLSEQFERIIVPMAMRGLVSCLNLFLEKLLAIGAEAN